MKPFPYLRGFCLKALFYFACGASLFAQPAQDTLYINFNSHCEESDKDPAGVTLNYAANQTQYTQYRAYVKQIADMVRSKGGKWNYQSDWNFLLAAQQFDKGDASTNGKNLLRWMAEDNNGQIQLDPHAHQNQYNYADVAYLLDQLSPTIKSSKNVGGFTWNGPMGAQTLMGMTAAGFTWDSLAKGLRGRKYPTYTWKAEVLLGGATYDYRRMQTGHGNDLNHSGAWRPRDTTSTGYMNHTCTAALANIGVGDDALIDSTKPVATVVTEIMTKVRAAITAMRANRGKFFTMQIQTNQRDFSRAGYLDKINILLDSLRPLAASGQIKWATHSEKAAAWKALYNEQPNFYPLTNGVDQCSTPPSGTPALTPSVATLPDFGSVNIGKTSSVQSYTLTGSRLAAIVSVSASQGFQVANSATGQFASTLTLTPSGGNLSAQVFVRFAPTSAGAISGTITHASGSATATTRLSGTALLPSAVRNEQGAVIFAVAPNPITDEMRVEFTLSRAERVKLSLYNALGQETASLLDVELPGGQHSYQFSQTVLPSAFGAYFLRLQTPTFTHTQTVQVQP